MTCFISHHIILHHIMQCYIISYHIILYHVILHHIISVISYHIRWLSFSFLCHFLDHILILNEFPLLRNIQETMYNYYTFYYYEENSVIINLLQCSRSWLYFIPLFCLSFIVLFYVKCKLPSNVTSTSKSLKYHI